MIGLCIYAFLWLLLASFILIHAAKTTKKKGMKTVAIIAFMSLLPLAWFAVSFWNIHVWW